MYVFCFTPFVDEMGYEAREKQERSNCYSYQNLIGIPSEKNCIIVFYAVG